MPVMPRQDQSETFEKRSILFKVKEGENFNRPAWYTKRQRHHTLKYFEDSDSPEAAESRG